jgi:hypothetical protein
MATDSKGNGVKSFDLDAMQRAWVAQSLATQRGVLVRSRQKEMPGGQIHELRGKEIAALDALVGIFTNG